MANRTCTVEDCTSDVASRGWCTTHYHRWRRNGTTDDLRPSPEERFWAKVDVGHPLGCWLWTGGRSSNGYGHFQVRPGEQGGAHRYAYTLLMGGIPDGMHLDHLCRNKPCVNPDHLEPTTPGENVLRAYGVTAAAKRATRCPHGHDYTAQNTYTDGRGRRYCRACRRRVNRERKARRRADQS